jgi:putative transposase
VKYHFLQQQSEGKFVNQLCRIMQESPSAYYAWLKRPAKLITGEELHLHRRAPLIYFKAIAV